MSILSITEEGNKVFAIFLLSAEIGFVLSYFLGIVSNILIEFLWPANYPYIEKEILSS